MFDLKNSSIFVMRTNLKFNDAHITKQAETKKRGLQTGASPAAFLRHRLGLVRSDNPSLFNSNPFIMRTKIKKRVYPRQASDKPNDLTIDQILNEFFLLHSATEVKEDLWQCFFAAIGSRDMDSWDATERSNLCFRIKQLEGLIDQLNSIHQLTKIA